MGHHHDDDDDAMEYEDEHEHSGGFLTGVLLGALIGVGAGLLMAPAAGQDTRHKIRDRAMAARDQAMQAAEDAKAKATDLAEDAKAKAADLQNSGREMIEENKRRLARTAEAVKQSAQEAWTSEPSAEPVSPKPVAPEQSTSMYMGQPGHNASGSQPNKAAHN